MVRLKRKFANLSLNPTQDPALWMSESEDIKNKIEPNMDEKSFLTHLISHLPPQYDDPVNLLEMMLFSTVDPLSLNTFRMMVCAKFDRMNIKTSTQSVALTANEAQSNRPKCTHCSKDGHTADKCWKKNPCNIRSIIAMFKTL